MLDVQDMHAYYGKSHILQGVNLRVNKRGNRCAFGAQWGGALDHM